MRDSCLEPGKIEALKMLDLQTKSTIISDKLHVQHQTTSRELNTGLIQSEIIPYIVGRG